MKQYLDVYPFGDHSSPNKLPLLLSYYQEACEYIKSRNNETAAFKAQVFEARENSKKKYSEFVMSIMNSTSETKEKDGNLQALESLKNEVTSIIRSDLKNMKENLTKLILENMRK